MDPRLSAAKTAATPEVRPVDGLSIAAVTLGALSLALATLAAASLLGGIVGAVAIAAGLASRSRLKADAQLRGSRLSLAGFLLGGIAVLIAAVALAPSAFVLLVAL